MRLLGVIAIVWTLDCFVGFYLTLPVRRRSNAARAVSVTVDSIGFLGQIETGLGNQNLGQRLAHQFRQSPAFGLWTWLLLFVIAFTAFSLNLYFEVFSPLMKTVSSYTPTPYELRTPAPVDQPATPRLSFADIIAKGEADGRSRGWSKARWRRLSTRSYMTSTAQLLPAGDDHGAGGVGPAQLCYDGQDGRPLGRVYRGKERRRIFSFKRSFQCIRVAFRNAGRILIWRWASSWLRYR